MDFSDLADDRPFVLAQPVVCVSTSRDADPKSHSEREKTEARAKEIALHRLFAALDANGDGAIDSAEFLTFMRIAFGFASATLEQAWESMQAKDLDDNGRLTFSGLQQACSEMEAAAIIRLCEPIEREAALKIYHSLQAEPPQPFLPPVMLVGSCSPLCMGLPPLETNEVVIFASKNVEYLHPKASGPWSSRSVQDPFDRMVM